MILELVGVMKSLLLISAEALKKCAKVPIRVRTGSPNLTRSGAVMHGAMWTVPRRCESKGTGWISEVVMAESVSRLWDLYGTPLLPATPCGPGPCSTQTCRLRPKLLIAVGVAREKYKPENSYV